ncbi:YeeE/YedE family protein, partial [Dyadobacter bucti]|uniref:YeeE/YedE family protein n=1 Tax=Dyadobacter bucti TaxID=2572203 RepID=UPI003F6F4A2C
HVCAMCVPAKIPFFQYDWKKELWNMLFVLGIFLGGMIAVTFMANTAPVQLNTSLVKELSMYGVTDFSSLVPVDLVSLDKLLTLPGFIMMVGGGFLVGFGARYAGGCTSGHAIMGLATLQWPSLVATICFMIGGFVMANWILPFILMM